jgi:hypothetical protein
MCALRSDELKKPSSAEARGTAADSQPRRAGACGQPSCPPEWLSDVERQLDMLRSLPENWDSYGAATTTESAVRAAQGFLSTLVREFSVPRPEVSPTRTGGVILEWASGPFELEVDIDPSGSASFLCESVETEEVVTAEGVSDLAHDKAFCEIVRERFASE